MSRSRSESSLSGPDKPVIVACKEQTEGLLSSNLRDMYLWVDVGGVKFIEGSSRRVQWFTPFNEITMWAVDTDFFQLRVVDKKGKLKERTFLCGSEKANMLKGALEETVKLYLQQPELVAELQKVAADFPVGSTVPKVELESADRFGSGVFVDQTLSNSKLASPAVAGRKSRFNSIGGEGPSANRGAPLDRAGGDGAPRLTPADSDVWKSESAMKGFPGRFIETTITRETVTEVIVIVKENGVHTINKNAKQGQQQRTFSFSHRQIVKTKAVDTEFRFCVRGSDGEISTLRYVFGSADGSDRTKVHRKIVEALAPFVNLRQLEKPPPPPRRAPPMFDDDGFEEENDAEEESYRVSQRVQTLAGIMQDCLERLGGLSTEDELMGECMNFMEKLSSFVNESAEDA